MPNGSTTLPSCIAIVAGISSKIILPICSNFKCSSKNSEAIVPTKPKPGKPSIHVQFFSFFETRGFGLSAFKIYIYLISSYATPFQALN